MKTRSVKNKAMKKQAGFTLVEVLVGLVLSLFIAGLAINYMTLSTKTFRAQGSDSIVQENARFALEILSQNFRLAGANPYDEFLAALQVVYQGTICPANESAQANGSSGSTSCTKDGRNNNRDNNSDRVAIDYVLDARNQTANLVTTGCSGTQITVPQGQADRYASVFWTANLDTTDNVRSLYCQSYNIETGLAVGTAAPLVDGVERLQVQYGVDSDGDDLVDRYQSFNNVNVNDWERVRTIRIALLMTSGIGISNDANTEEKKSRSFQLLDAPAETFDDRLLRQIYSTTVMVHNNL